MSDDEDENMMKRAFHVFKECSDLVYMYLFSSVSFEDLFVHNVAKIREELSNQSNHLFQSLPIALLQEKKK